MKIGLLRFVGAPVLTGCVLALGSAGCSSSQPVTMQDDFDLDLFGPQKDDLSTPYVAGAKFSISVDAHDGSDTTGWTVVSSDPTVMQVGDVTTNSQTTFSVSIKALQAGHATLTVKDKAGKVRDSHDVDVGVPDRITLYAHGLLLAGVPDDQARVDQVRVLDGGKGTFLVRYFEGNQELSGNGALHPVGSGSATASTAQSSLAQSRDWLEVTAGPGGDGQVALDVGGTTVTTVPVTSVEQSAVANVGIAAQSPKNAKDGDSLLLFARAIDQQGNDVYGASFAWSIDGQSQTAQTSLFSSGSPADDFSYPYKASASEDVSAALAGYSVSTTVHGQGGTVGSTSDVGCSAAPGPAGAADAGVIALGVALASAMVRRKRARTSV